MAFSARQAPRPSHQQPNNPPAPRNPKKDQPRTGTCNWCKREGHWESDCQKKESQAQAQQGTDKSNNRRADKQKNKVGNGNSTVAGAPKSWVAKLEADSNVEEAKSTHGHPVSGDWWEFDSGASRVFHGNLAAFSNYKAFDMPMTIGLTGEEAITKALGSRTLAIRFIPPNSPPIVFHISNAYHTPGMMNLISISHLDNLGRKIQFHSKHIHIWNGDELELSVPRVGTYKCRGEVIMLEQANAVKVSHTSWHRRCAHLGHSSLQELA